MAGEKRAVVLLSGGLDSTTVLAIAKDMGYLPYALSVFYGQRNEVELLAAKRVAEDLGAVAHRVIELDLRAFGGSALTDDMAVGDHADLRPEEIPNTYVPARNTILLSLALAYAETIGAFDIFFGANVHDYSGYPDCRPAFIKAYEAMANLGLKCAGDHRIAIRAPLVDLPKAEIIKKGIALGVRYGMTHSCYNPKIDLACGRCSACFYRRKGFINAGVADPTRYVDLLPNDVFV